MSEPTQPPNSLKQTGGTMFLVCLSVLAIGRAVVRVFFPELRAHSPTPGMLLVLVPIWSVAVIGVLLWLVGHLRGKT